MAKRLIDLDETELEALLNRVLDKRIAELLADKPPKLLTKEQLAEWLVISEKTVDRLRKEGLPCLMAGDSPRFDRERCTAWLEARGEEPGQLRLVGSK
jgi:hypothetical protein